MKIVYTDKFKLKAGVAVGVGANVLPVALHDFKKRVKADDAIMDSFNDAARVYRLLQQQGLLAGVKVAFVSNGGYDVLVDGLLKYYVTGYEFSGEENDLTGGDGVTEATYPRQVGGIAPASKVAASKQVGDTRYFTHTGLVVAGTYTVVQMTDVTGKYAVSYSEVAAGTISQADWTGNLRVYFVYAGTIAAGVRTAINTGLLGIYPEIESTVIGTDTWSNRNFEAVATPVGNVIANVTEAGNVERITNGDFSVATNWITDSWVIASGKAGVNTGVVRFLRQTTGTAGKWYKATYTVLNFVGGGVAIRGGTTLGTTRSVNGTYTEYIKSNETDLGVQNVGATQLSVDDVSFEEVGWSGLTDLYTWLKAEGYSDYNAYKEVAAWCYQDNLVNSGATYGKMFNGYANKLLLADLVTASFGWHVSTDAEYQTIDDSAYDLMMSGTNYWTTANGTNAKSLTLLGGGYRLADGSFAPLKGSTRLWVGDADKTVQLTDNSDTVTIAAEDLRIGGYIRLVKN